MANLSGAMNTNIPDSDSSKSPAAVRDALLLKIVAVFISASLVAYGLAITMSIRSSRAPATLALGKSGY